MEGFMPRLPLLVILLAASVFVPLPAGAQSPARPLASIAPIRTGAS
jgi:hypothetical protein